MSAPRVWWTFKQFFGHSSVHILEGGLQKWLKEKLTVTDQYPNFEKVKYESKGGNTDLIKNKN